MENILTTRFDQQNLNQPKVQRRLRRNNSNNNLVHQCLWPASIARRRVKFDDWCSCAIWTWTLSTVKAMYVLGVLSIWFFFLVKLLIIKRLRSLSLETMWFTEPTRLSNVFWKTNHHLHRQIFLEPMLKRGLKSVNGCLSIIKQFAPHSFSKTLARKNLLSKFESRLLWNWMIYY